MKEYIPKTWINLQIIKGFFVSSSCRIIESSGVYANGDNKNIVPYRAHCTFILAFCQLTQLMKDYYSQTDWKPNWESNEINYCLRLYDNKIIVSQNIRDYHYLAFKSEKDANLFYEYNKQLVEDYLQIL